MIKRIGLILLMMLIGSVPLMATQIEVKGEIQRLESGDSVTDTTEASHLNIKLPNAYEKAGKTEKIKVTLENAIWEMENLSLENLEGIEAKDVSLAINSETELEFYIKLPSDLTKETEVSFSLPILMMMNGNGEIASLTVSDGEVLFETKQFVVAANTDKLLMLSIGEVEEFKNEGIVAPITLSEVVPNAMGTNEVSFIMTLTDSDVEFGNVKYTAKSEVSNATIYTLDHLEHVEVSGGFAKIQDDIKVVVRKYTGNKKLYVTLKANLASEVGSITLKNIPLVYIGDTPKNRDIKVTIEEDSIIGTGKNITIAHQITLSKEEQEAAQKEQEEAEQASKEEAEQTKEESKNIRFTVGDNSYTAYDKTYEMDGEVFIQSPGYVMVPIRYVAEALGVSAGNIIYGGGDLSFSYGDREIMLSVGSSQAWVNRTPITMATEVTIIEGRSYAPIGEVAKILGIQKEWDSETKTAIFTK